LIEKVFVLVFRRTVAKNESSAIDRTERQFFDKPSIRKAEAIARPLRGDLRGLVESGSLFGRRHEAVVIAANVVLLPSERAHGIEHLIRFRAIADEIAETCD